MSSFSSQSSRSGLASHTDTARLEALSRSDKLKRVRTGHQQASHRERVNDGYRPKPSNSMRPEASLCSLQNRIRTPNPAQSLSHHGHIDHNGHASPASCRSSSGRGSPFRSRIKFGAYLPQFPQRPDSPASSSSCNEALGPAAPSHFIRQSAEFQTCNTPYLASSSINAFRRSTPRQDIQVPPDLTDSSLSSSPQLVLFPNTPNLPHLLRPNPIYAYLLHSGSVSSFDTTSSVPSPPRLRSPHPETSSPSASPRSRKAGSPRCVGFMPLLHSISRYFGFPFAPSLNELYPQSFPTSSCESFAVRYAWSASLLY